MLPLLRGVEEVLSQRLKGAKPFTKNSIARILCSSPTFRTAPRLSPENLEHAQSHLITSVEI